MQLLAGNTGGAWNTEPAGASVPGTVVCDLIASNTGKVVIERILGPRPEGKTLDRKRNGLGYKPSNVRWATRWEQAHGTAEERAPVTETAHTASQAWGHRHEGHRPVLTARA